MVLDELPGGYVQPGENVADAAARELAEETGFAADEIHVVGRAWLAANSRLEQFITVALGCTATADRAPDPLEFIEVRLQSLPDFRGQVRRGDMTGAGLPGSARRHTRTAGPPALGAASPDAVRTLLGDLVDGLAARR